MTCYFLQFFTKLTATEKKLNKALSSVPITTEHLFGILKA